MLDNRLYLIFMLMLVISMLLLLTCLYFILEIYVTYMLSGDEYCIHMSPYDFIYGPPYTTPLSWNHLKYQAILGLKILQEMEEQMDKKMIV